MQIMHIWTLQRCSILKTFSVLYTVHIAVPFSQFNIYTYIYISYISIMPACLSKNTFLPSSSSSEVIDLDRKVSAVVGARLGGGGALH